MDESFVINNKNDKSGTNYDIISVDGGRNVKGDATLYAGHFKYTFWTEEVTQDPIDDKLGK